MGVACGVSLGVVYGMSLGVVHGVSHRVGSGTAYVACGVAHRVTLEVIVVWHVNEDLTQQKKKVKVQLSDV
jgi:hypothetical protein